jgi:hypothetical protein
MPLMPIKLLVNGASLGVHDLELKETSGDG